MRTGDYDQVFLDLKRSPPPSKEEVLAALRVSQTSLNAISMSSSHSKLCADYDVVLTAVSRNGRDLAFASDSMKRDPSIVLAAVGQSGDALQFAHASCKSNADIVSAAIRKYAPAIAHADPLLLKGTAAFRDALCEQIRRRRVTFSTLPSSVQEMREVVLAAVSVDGLLLETLSFSLQRDEEVVRAAVAQNPDAIEFASRTLRQTKAIALSAVSRDGRELDNVGGKLQDDEDVVRAAIQQNSSAFRFASNRLQQVLELAKIALSRDATVYRSLCGAAKANVDIAHLAVSINGMLLSDAPSSIQANEAVVIAAIGQFPDAIEFAARALRQNKSVAMVALSRDGMELANVGSTLQDDEDVVTAAVRAHPRALEFASSRLRAHRVIVETAVRGHAVALVFADPALQADRTLAIPAVRSCPEIYASLCSTAKSVAEIALCAVSANGMLLAAVPSSLQDFREVVETAVTQNPAALQFASRSLQDDKALVLLALKREGNLLSHASPRLRKDRDTILVATTQNPLAIQYADPSAVDRTIALAVVSRAVQMYRRLTPELQADRGIFMTAVRLDKTLFSIGPPNLKCDPEVLALLNDKLRFQLTGNPGIPFPPALWPVGKSKAESRVKATVSDCLVCKRTFRFYRRKHHCHICGDVFCTTCSFIALRLSNSTSTVKERVCLLCFENSRLAAQRRRFGGPPLVMPSDDSTVAARRDALHRVLAEMDLRDDRLLPAMDLLLCVDVVVVLDDSGSMKFPANPDIPNSANVTRWVELQRNLTMMFRVLQATHGAVDIYFMNRRDAIQTSSEDALRLLFNDPPSGGTPTVGTLQRAWARKNISDDSPKPLVTYVFTDGQPDGSFESLETLLDLRPGKRKSLVSFVLCTDEEPVVAKYRRLENEVVLTDNGIWNTLGIPGVDVTEDFVGECRDVVRAGRQRPLTRSEYLVKLLVGTLEPAVHLIDLPARPVFWSATNFKLNAGNDDDGGE